MVSIDGVLNRIELDLASIFKHLQACTESAILLCMQMLGCCQGIELYDNMDI